MRIGLVVATSEPGGVTTVTRQLARGFAEAGHHVELHVIKPLRGLSDEDAAPYSVQHWGCRTVRAGLWSMRRLFRSGSCDVVITAQSYVNVMAAIARPRRCRTAFLAVEHSSVSGVAQSGNMRDRLMPLAMRVFLRRADAVAAVSEGAANELRRVLRVEPGRVEVLPNPVLPDTTDARPIEPPEHPFFLDLRVPIVLAVGRLAPEKRFGDLIAAFAILRVDVDARLVIVGDGPERSRLESLLVEHGIADDAWLPGYVSDPTSFYVAADLLVLSSEFEGLPVVVIEGLAAGSRVVATDCPHGPREILHEGRLGRLVPVRNPGALADAMVAALAGPPPASDEVAEALHPYRVANAVSRYIDVIRSLAVGRTGDRA